MPQSPTWEETVEIPTWEDTVAEGQPSEVKAAPLIKLSPYEQANLESMMAGRGKLPTGMEAGTGLVTAIAEDPERFLQTPLVPIPRIEAKSTLGKIAAAPVNVAGGLIQGMETPLGVLTLGLGGPVAKAAFAGLAAKSAGEQLGTASVTGDPGQIAEGILGAGLAPAIALHRTLPPRPGLMQGPLATGEIFRSPERGVPTALGNEELQAEAAKQAAILAYGRTAKVQALRPAVKLVPEKPGEVAKVAVGEQGDRHNDINKRHDLTTDEIDKKTMVVSPTGEAPAAGITTADKVVDVGREGPAAAGVGGKVEPATATAQAKTHASELAKAQEVIPGKAFGENTTPEQKQLLKKLSDARDRDWKSLQLGGFESIGITREQFDALKAKGLVDENEFGPSVTMKGALEFDEAVRQSVKGTEFGRKYAPESEAKAQEAPPSPAAAPAPEPPTPPVKAELGGRDWELFNENLRDDLESFAPARETGKVDYDLQDVADRFVEYAKADKSGKSVDKLVSAFAKTDEASPSQIRKLRKSVKSVLEQEAPKKHWSQKKPGTLTQEDWRQYQEEETQLQKETDESAIEYIQKYPDKAKASIIKNEGEEAYNRYKKLAEAKSKAEPPTPPAAEQKPPPPADVGPGMGGAKAEGEILEGTSLKNATAEAERIGLNLPKHYEPAAHEMLKAVNQAMRLEQENPGAGERLGNELIANPEMGLNDVQSALLLRRKVDLFKAVNDAAERTHIGDESSRKAAQAQHDELAVKLTNLLDAIRFRGSEWGREGRWRQAMMREDYSFDSLDNIERYKRTVSENPFTPEEKKAAENFAGRVKKANERSEKISGALDKKVRDLSRKAETDAEQRALDAASKTVRENAIRLANAEKKLRVARTVNDYETAQIQVKTAREALDQSIKTRDDAVKAARAESRARVEQAVKAKDLAEVQEAEAEKAHKAALDAVRNTAANLRKAEGKERVKEAKLARVAAQTQLKTTAKALDKAAKLRKDAVLKMVKEERRNLGDPMGAVWRKAKEYLEKGVSDMDDIRKKVATDLGMSVQEVVRWMARDKKTKFLADELWRQQKIARELRLQAKRWVDNLDRTRAEKIVRGTPTFFFRAKTAGHGGVALGTHAPFVLYQPRFWGVYSRNFVDMHKMVWNNAYYESKMNDLVRSDNWAKANQAGLVNDPRQFEEFAVPGAVSEGKGTISKEFLEKWNAFTGAGNRGYAVLKLLRQDMFDQMWNRLPRSKQIAEVAMALAEDINHITGVVKASPPKGSNLALFAPRLLASRVMTLAADPAKAAWYFMNWKNASVGQRMFAMNQLKGKVWMLATGFSLLVANQGILTALGSKQKINGVPKALGGAGFDPMESDFLKFKGFGYAGSYGNAMITMGLLPLRVAMAIAYHGKASKLVLEDERVDKVIADYLRSQAAPFAGTVADVTLGRDFQGRPLKRKLLFTMEGDPYVPKRLQKHGVTKPYGWFEYGSQAIAPIPVSEPLKEMYQTGVGLSEKQLRQLAKASAVAVLQAGTGGRLVEDPRLKK